jgi:hypothetical protein
MGFSRHLVFGDSNPSNGSFFSPPTITGISEAGPPCGAAEAISLVLIGRFPVLEQSSYKKDTQSEVSRRDSTNEKGGRARRWGCT